MVYYTSMDTNGKFYTIETASKELGKPRNTISRWLKAGRFPHSMVEGRVKVITPADVESVRKEEAAKLIDELAKLGFTCEITPANGQS